MKTLRALAVSLACLLASAVVSADVQKKTLLTSDGTLYQVQSGRVSELGVTGPGLEAENFAIVWSSLAQDGTAAGGLIPNVANSNPKTSLDLTFDEPTQTLAVLWREENTILNSIRLGFLRAGAWSIADLLPHVGFPHAYNPEMLLTHSTVHTLDEDGSDVYTPRSILSIVWWEESSYTQARYAGIFLDEPIDGAHVGVYDLPALVGVAGPPLAQDIPFGSYAFPALQSEGPSGAVLVTFATLSSDQQFVVRLTYPTEFDNSDIGKMTWQRRRIPVVGIQSQGPIFASPVFGAASAVSTVVGSSYHPTLYWQDGPGVFYIRYDGTAWSAVRAIALTDDVTYDKAVALILSMAQRN